MFRAEPDIATHRSSAPLWHVTVFWLVAATLLLVRMALLDDPTDADSLLRMQQVQDLLAGQSWWDVTQYRMNPPEGTPMHWSRLVDIPIAALILFFGLFMTQASAQFWASAILPLFYLGTALFMLRAIMVQLQVPGKFILIGLGLSVVFPLLPAAFAPLNIDHHGPQALAALGATLMFVKAPSPRAAIAGGVFAAAWCAISLEGLPVLAVFAGAYALRYVFLRDLSLRAFLTAVAIAAPLFSAATRPPSEYAMWCDILLPAHFAGFAAAAALAWIVTLAPKQDTPPARFASLAILPIVCGPLVYTLLGSCASDPYGARDPLVGDFFYSYVRESLPFWGQNYDVMAMMLYLPVIIAAGCWSARQLGWITQETRATWAGYLLVLSGITLYGLGLMREMVMAQMLALPFALALLLYWLPKARALSATLPRVFATVLVLLAVGPLGVTLAGKIISGQVVAAQDDYIPIVLPKQNMTHCDFTKLRALEKGHVFATMNFAPDVIGQSHHSVEVGGYHRAEEALRRSILAFRSHSEEARAIMQSRGTDYLAVCLMDDSLQLFGKDRPDSLAQRLLRNDIPEWLELHPDFENSKLRVYHVR